MLTNYQKVVIKGLMLIISVLLTNFKLTNTEQGLAQVINNDINILRENQKIGNTKVKVKF